MPRLLLAVAAMSSVVFVPTVLAADAQVCPESIVVAQRVSNTPRGWEARRQHVTHQLVEVTFFSGHPKNQESLVPDNEGSIQTEHLARWRFDPASEDGYWVRCAYYRTDVVLMRRLPREVRTCEVGFDADLTVGGLPLVRSVTCR